MCVIRLGGVTALRSRDARHLRWRSRLDDSAVNVVELLLDLVMVVRRGALFSLTVGISVGALGIGACGCMERVIHLLSLVWGMGMLAGACTLGTHCVLRI